MDVRSWLALRGPDYIGRRAAALVERYGLTPRRAAERALGCVSALAAHGCAPTLPTPGSVVGRYSDTVRRLQQEGAEIAVHSYDHIDLSACPPAGAAGQLVRAARTFERCGIAFSGFRCPYLGCTDALLEALPAGLFSYSSNQAVWWDTTATEAPAGATSVLATLQRFYRPRPAARTVCVPWLRAGMVEIPASLPDDLQLHDGLRISSAAMARVWCDVLKQTHERGELFVLLFHPELTWSCQEPFVSVLEHAARLRPAVWVAPLREIAAWWRERSAFTAATVPAGEHVHIALGCSVRATVLAKGLDLGGQTVPWGGPYARVHARELLAPATPRPFVGLDPEIPSLTADFLRNQGYIVEVGPLARECAIYLDIATLARLQGEVELLDWVESSPGPLVRYWRWPDGAQSALSITGDLDALTLVDYALRLAARS